MTSLCSAATWPIMYMPRANCSSSGDCDQLAAGAIRCARSRPLDGDAAAGRCSSIPGPWPTSSWDFP